MTLRLLPPPGRLVFNVQDFAARGDNATNDTSAVTKAIGAAAAAGGIVYFPPGTYRLSDIQVTGASNLTLDLGSATLKLPNGLTKANARCFLFTSCTNLVIRGGTLDGNRSNVDVSGAGDGAAIGLQFVTCDDVSVEDTRLINFATDGAYLSSGGVVGAWCTNVTMRGVLFYNSRRNGCSLIAAKNVTFAECTFSTSNGTAPQSGCDLEPNAGMTVEDVKFSACHFLNNSTTGLQFSAGSVGAITRAEAVNCTFYGNATYGVLASAEPTQCAVRGGSIYNPSTASAGVYAYCSGLEVAGVRIVCASATQHGIRFDSGSAYQCIARGNQITGVFQYGIYLNGNNTYAGGGEHLIQGNKIVGGATCNTGIYLLQSLWKTQLLGNRVAGVPVGIRLSAADKTLIQGNVITDAVSNGMLLQTSDHLQVSGNTVDGTTTGNGIRMEGSFSVFSGNVLRGNGQTGLVLVGASDNVVTGNLIKENSQQTDNTYYGIYVDSTANRNLFTGNTIRRGALTNKQNYGLRIAASNCAQNVIGPNDLYDSGTTGYLADAGTSTLFLYATAITLPGDADYTHTPWTNAANVNYATALTAPRSCSFSNTQAVKGMRGRVTRTAAATGASSLLVKDGSGSTLATLAVSQWCEVEYNGSAWVLTELGLLSYATVASTGSAADLTGTLSDSRLSANVALLNGTPTSPVFSADVTVPNLIANAAAGTTRRLNFKTSGVNRWVMGATLTAETGADAGSNWEMLARHDDGTAIGVALSIVRATMAATLGGALTVTGNLSFGGTTFGAYGVAATTRPAAYTQTYATATRTHSNLTSSDLSGITSSTTGSALAEPGAAYSQAVLQQNFRRIQDQYNALKADLTNLKQVVNQIIDDLQAEGWLQ